MPNRLELVKPDNDILRQRAEEISDPSDRSIQSLIDDMLYTTEAYNGVGLAAPQIGVSKRLIIVASRPNARYPYAPDHPPEAMINPEILSYSQTQEAGWEGCLSVPKARGKVFRSSEIELAYLDRFGEQIQKHFTGFLARIIQHEVDHLNGLSFVDRMREEDELISEQEFLEQLKL